MNRMDTKRRAAIVAALVEGVGIRSTCRMTGASKGAVTKLIADLGPVCAAYMDEAFRELPCILVGSRDAGTATEFCQDLASRLAYRPQITTDGLKVYIGALEDAFNGDLDYAMLQKIYAAAPGGETRYSPAECTGIQKQVISGNPDRSKVSTSYVERANLSIRMGLRRYTRLTNAHSKKLENHCAALAIYFMYYNFARLHQTIRCTPAMAAGVTPHLWSIAEIVELLPAEAPKKRGPYKKKAAA